MNAAARLLAHATTFALLACVLEPAAVAPDALLGLFLSGTLVLALGPCLSCYPHAARTWAQVVFYSLLLGGLFFGADFALLALGNSVKPRAILPPAFGGLELYWVLVPGVASVGAGAWVGALLRQRHR